MAKEVQLYNEGDPHGHRARGPRANNSLTMLMKDLAVEEQIVSREEVAQI